MSYYDTLSPEELEKYKVDIIENSKTGDQYQIVHRNDRYEIDFFAHFLFVPSILIRHNIGKFYMNNDKKICFEFSDSCPEKIKDSMTHYYGNGIKGMMFTNTLTGETSNDLLDTEGDKDVIN